MTSLNHDPRAIDLHCPLCGPVHIAVIAGDWYRVRIEVWLNQCRIVAGTDRFETEVHSCGAPDPVRPAPWNAEPEYRATFGCALCEGQPPEAERFVEGHARSDHIKGGMIAICDRCLDAGRRALDDSGQADWVLLPLRILGTVPDPAAPAEIVAAFQTVFGTRDLDSITRALEDSERFQQSIARQHARLPDTWPDPVRVDRIRFLDAENAQVEFAHTHDGGTIERYEGDAIYRAQRWLVRAQTFTQLFGIDPSGPE